MTKSITKRISDSFEDDESAARAKDYSDKIYAAWKDVATSLGRATLLIVLLVAIFELLAYEHGATAISIGSFTLANAPIVQIALPTVIAFAFYDAYRLSARWMNLQTAYIELTKMFDPKQSANELELLIAPPTSALWGLGVSSSSELTEEADKFLENVNTIIFVAVEIFLPILFECQAYYRLFQKFGYRNIILWVSLLITVLVIFCIVWYVRLFQKSED